MPAENDALNKSFSKKERSKENGSSAPADGAYLLQGAALVTPISAFSGVFCSTSVQFNATILVPAPLGMIFLG